MSCTSLRRLRDAFGALALTLLFAGPASAQLPTSVDIDLVPGTAPNTLDVRLRANGNSFDEVISNLLFTVRWPNSSPATLGLGSTDPWCPLPNSAFSPGPSAQVSAPAQNPGFKYRTYNSVGLQQIGLPQDPDGGCSGGRTLPAGTWVKVFTITVSNNTNCTEFNIVNDAYTSDLQVNKNYFISLNGNQTLTGTINSTPACISTSNCGTSITSASGTSPVCQGSALNLTTTATGGGALSYFWVGPNGFTSTLQNPIISNVTAAASGTYTVTVAAAGACTGQNISQSFDVVVSAPPTTATVGGAQSICPLGTTTALGGNTPVTGTGQWSVSGGTGTFNPDATTPNATFTHATGAGPLTLTWTISNPPCTSSNANVTLTITQPPTTATVGGAQTICALGTTTGLGGNTPTTGTGQWSIVGAGTGTFNPNATTPNATFTHATGAGPLTLRWRISSGTCTPSDATVTVTINQPPTTATVGGAQSVCALGTTTGLGGNTPTTGTGQWSVTGGTGTFNPNATTPNATFTHATGTGPLTLTWTISNAPCTASSANVTLTITQGPTAATVGGPQTICALGTTTGLGGNTPTTGTGQWSIVGAGTGTFNPNATTPNATFTHATGAGPLTLRWRISSGTCTPSDATVTVTITQAPTTATVGGAQTICALGTTTGLGGNTPTTGTGQWSIVGAGTGTFNPNATTPNATFTHATGAGPLTLRWRISSGTCTPSDATVTVTINQPPTTATVGGAQSVCALGTTTGLGGNTPTTGTGQWSVTGGTGTFNPNATTPNATFTHATGTGPLTLTWTISNAPCTASSANVTLTITQGPTAATVGGPQTICALGTTTGLGGNTPTTGTGQWSIVGAGTGTFNPNATTPNATFTHATGAGPLTLRWRISSGGCTPSDATVTVTINQPPTTATVGGAQTVCALGTTTGLGGNTPTTGTGQWSVTGGTGTFNPNATTPNATFTHATGTGPLTLTWTISNAPCTASSANVSLTITQPPTTATVGGAQSVCALGTTTGLGGNTPTTGTGQWSVTGGTGTFNPNATTPNATFTHATGTGPLTLTWTISNAPCTASSANVTLTITQGPTAATVGGPQTICALGTTTGLGGNTPTTGTGQWSIVGAGTGTFNPNATTPNATFTHATGAGPLTLRWRISSGTCTPSDATVTVTITQAPTTATVGGAQTICALGTTTGLGGNTPTTGTGQWSIVGAGTGTFNPNATTPNATFTHATGAGPLTLRWRISSGTCTPSDATVTVTINQPPTTATVGGAQSVCALGTTTGLGGNTPTTGTGQWSMTGGTGTFNPNATTPNATFTHATGTGPLTLTWTISNAPCTASSANVTLTITPAAPVADAGSDQAVCSTPGTATMAANSAAPGTGTWTQTSGTPATITSLNSPTTTITGLTSNGDRVFRWTITNPPCAQSFEEVTVSVSSSATWFQDEDNDGFGNPAISQSSCSQPPGYVSNSNDLCLNTPTGEGVNTDGCSCSQIVVEDSNPCTLDECLNGVVTHTPITTDTDGDGVPNCSDNCPTVPGQIGSACTDGNACTDNDVLNASCQCVGTPNTTDTDGDGVPNCSDNCPAVPGQIGSTCNDGNACTDNDVLNASCQCVGTPNTTDTDGDEVPDCSDNCPNTPGQIGSSCDDGNASTGPDVINGNCVCEGPPLGAIDCNGVAGGPAQPGTPCNDNDPCTDNDVYTGAFPNCGCAGTPNTTDTDGDGVPNCSDNCPAVPGQIGSTCNDGNACTDNDVLNASCQCVGTPNTTDTDGDGVPNCSDNCPTVPGQIGSACTDGNVCTDNDVLNASCQCVGTPNTTDTDGDEVPDCSDNCPNTPGQIGSSCDDGNASTGPDVINGNCVCEGPPLGAIDCNGVTGGPAQPGTPCNDNDPCTDNDVYTGAFPNCGCAGTANTTDADGDGVPNCSDSCPTVPGQIGSACNDGNACTDNDVLNASCQCVGTPNTSDTDGDEIPDCSDNCPNTPGQIGSSCDDGNASTGPDVINGNCVCEGPPLGAIDCNGVAGGPAQPGTPCNDNDPCTDNDVYTGAFPNCGCAGTPNTTDTDGDGVPNCSDNCPAVPGQIGSTCNDGNACTDNDVLNASCQCVGTPNTTDTDGDGVPNCSDNCPTVPGQIGSACTDGNVCTDNDVLNASCQCVGTPNTTDTDGDEVPDCSDNCPNTPGQIGSSCDDGNASTGPDVINSDCQCVGAPIGCDHPVNLILQTDANGGQTSWEILPQAGGLPVCSGGPYPGSNNTFVSELCCLTQGCYRLRVLDSGGDGMTTGGYVLVTNTGARIIDNREDGVFGTVSQISGGQGFCVPIGTDRVIYSSCDRTFWQSGEYIVASQNPAVSAQWLVGDQTDDGYEFWFFDPDGTYSFRRFRNHATSDGFAPANATRACHAKLNNWAAANQIPLNVLLNVRVRGRVNGVNNEWGPACRFKMDPVLAQCPPTMLVNEPGSTTFSCGVTRRFGTSDKVYAWPRPGANRYQFEFTISGEPFLKTVTATTSYVTLNWVANPLQDGNTYTVRARISKNNGVSYCAYGDPCLLTIDNTPIAGGTESILMETGTEGPAGMRMWPNPNNGEQLFLAVDELDPTVETVAVDLFDMYGKRIMTKAIPTSGGQLNTVFDLDADLTGGMYIVHLSAGGHTWTERLVIQR